MKKKLLYITLAFGFVVSISATPAFTSEASACGWPAKDENMCPTD
ncbi:hypothetical protein [Cytobacillus massiliigabonensis]|nr:hypothetical protein [Cytobacillus massiliigabonensis]